MPSIAVGIQHGLLVASLLAHVANLELLDGLAQRGIHFVAQVLVRELGAAVLPFANTCTDEALVPHICKARVKSQRQLAVGFCQRF